MSNLILLGYLLNVLNKQLIEMWFHKATTYG